jgi:thioredoxin-related protein
MYLIASLAITPFDLNSIFNPMIYGLISLILSYYYINILSIKPILLSAFLGYMYSYHINPIFKEGLIMETANIEQIEEKDLKEVNNIYQYKFENNSRDTVELKNNNKFIILETWNETCPPCIEAMKDLQPLFDSLSIIADHYFLYENGSDKLYITKHKIFNFSRIYYKNDIIMDLNNKLYKDLNMQSFPYFLLFDKKGKLIDYFKGYDPKHKEYFVNRLKKMVSLY